MNIIVEVSWEVTSYNLVGADVLEESTASIFYTEELVISIS
jgi:hypothetical protein